MEFPLNLSFKIVALAPQIQVTDRNGNSVCYVRQKILKLKESVEVFTDKSKSQRIAKIKADRIIDFSARYWFRDANDNIFGSIKRLGMRSLWKSHYEVTDESENPLFTIREANPWVKVVDSILGEVPIVGALTGYMLNPTYHISRTGTDDVVVKIRKVPAFWEGKFEIQEISDIDEQEELRLTMATLMMVLLERRRG